MPSSFSNDREALNFASALAEDLSTTLEGLRQAAYRRADGQLFEDLRASLTLNLVKHTWLTDIKSVEYLAPLVRTAVIEDFPVVTLNYDNTIELCAESMGIACREIFPGLNDKDNQSQTSSAHASSIDLYKLHGSANWVWNNENSRSSDIPEISPLSTSEMRDVLSRPVYGVNRSRQRPAVIFGGKNKLTAEGPFLDLFINSVTQHKTEVN